MASTTVWTTLATLLLLSVSVNGQAVLTCSSTLNLLYVDEVQLIPPAPPNGGVIGAADAFNINSYSRLIAIRGVNLAADYCSGILFSHESTVYNHTSSVDWRCSASAPAGWQLLSYNDSAWPIAVSSGKNGNDPDCNRPELYTIRDDADWIWTTDYVNGDPVVSCRGFTSVCAYMPCENGGTCSMTAPNLCACPNRWIGMLCEIPDGECLSDPCANGATCTEVGAAGFVCTCAPGYSGLFCQNDITPCGAVPCQNNGTCINDGNGVDYTCHCVPGITGGNCETNIDECASIPCQNGGTCNDLINSYTCTCAPGFTGIFCQFQINYCNSNPCRNSATCVPGINSYVCQCLAGWTGTLCETATGVCVNETLCLNGGQCYEDGGGNALCQCTPQWTGSHCETLYDNCLSNPCVNNGTCQNMEGAFGCNCPPQWTGSMCQNVAPHCGDILHMADYPAGRGFWSLCWITTNDTLWLSTICTDLIRNVFMYGDAQDILAYGGAYGCYGTNNPAVLPDYACIAGYGNTNTLGACISCTHFGVCIREPTSQPTPAPDATTTTAAATTTARGPTDPVEPEPTTEEPASQ